MTSSEALRISNRPGELNEGLFGQIVLYVFEVLPYLKANGIYPDWNITSKLYGRSPDFTVLPGVFDLAYTPPRGKLKEVDLYALRAAHTSVLGGDWRALHDLWHSYFRVPQRVLRAADGVDIGAHTLGVHYRGQDKNALTHGDTNSVSQGEFLTLVRGFLDEHARVDSLFVATDEYSFVKAISAEFPHLKIINLGEVDFHKQANDVPQKADRALLDAVLLSRCEHVIKCSSALSSFAKVLRPELSIFRIAACKLFADIPYFPDAYIPTLHSSSPESNRILGRLMKDDWLDNPEARQRFGTPFVDQPRFTGQQKLVSWVQYQRHRIRRFRGRVA